MTPICASATDAISDLSRRAGSVQRDRTHIARIFLWRVALPRQGRSDRGWRWLWDESHGHCHVQMERRLA